MRFTARLRRAGRRHPHPKYLASLHADFTLRHTAFTFHCYSWFSKTLSKANSPQYRLKYNSRAFRAAGEKTQSLYKERDNP